MKRIVIFTVALLALTFLRAQQAEDIRGIVMSEHSSDYYAEQTRLWASEVKKHPRDERAWRNYFEANRYRQWQASKDDDSSSDILARMQQAIPDSYTYYICRYRERQGGERSVEAAEQALKRLPANHSDHDTWVGYFMMTAQAERLSKMAAAYYETGSYAPNILQYNYNELQGMEHGGIYVGNGDVTLIPKILLQEGRSLHRDKVVVCYSMLSYAPYVEALFKKLGIGRVPAPKKPLTSQNAYEAYSLQLLEEIRRKSGRPLYFSAFDVERMVPSWKDSLYNEGLTMKFSGMPYDNRAVKRRNVEERYKMEYLTVSFEPREWSAGSRLSVNYAVLLRDLLPIYKKQNRKRYEWLKSTLTSAITETAMDGAKKNEYLQLLDQ